MMKKAKATPKNILYFAQGNYRYFMYYSRINFFGLFTWYFLRPFLRPHIKEQFVYRVKWMNNDCYNQGSCTECGCETTPLQMADKKCDGLCYPPMMTWNQWRKYKKGYGHYTKNGCWLQEQYLNNILAVKGSDKPIFLLKINEDYVHDNSQRTGDGSGKS